MPTFYEGAYHIDLLQSEQGKLYDEEKFRGYIADIRPPFSSGRARDVGCATGTKPALLRAAGYDAEGLEINPKTADFAAATHRLKVHSSAFEQFEESNGPTTFSS
jgi:SAM-dependent methyltransferase